VSPRLLALGAITASLLVPSASAATFADPYDPDASFVVSNEPRRVGQPIDFVALVDGYSRYQWNFGDGSFGRGPEAAHRYREPGRYTVILEVVTAGGAYAAENKSITVHGAPSPDELPTIRGRVARSHKDPELSKAAAAFGKKLTGKWSPRAVLCWNELDWSTLTGPKYEIVAGFVEYRSPRQVNLSPDICRRMELVRYKRPRPAATLFTAFSMLVFTHEVVHTHGIGNEAAATCFALQLTGFMSRALGTNEAFATRLEVLLTRWYRRSNLAPGYWSPQCRDGGRLDLVPEERGWPLPQRLR
jgi:hypothetical protein